MDFNDTGLPQDQTVLKAFMMFSRNAKPAADEPDAVPGQEEQPVRAAQALVAAGATDVKVISLALLGAMPKETYSLVEKSFGAEMVTQLKEITKHNATGYAYINEASLGVQLVSLANSIATFDVFQKETEKAGEALDKIAAGEKMEKAELTIPMLPNTRVFERMSQMLAGKTGLSALESSFDQKLGDLRYSNDQFREKILSSGIADQLPPEVGAMLNQPNASNYSFPSFAESGLLDNEKVRAAYDVLVTHPLVQPQDFEAALEVGKLLSTKVASANPTAIASGLLDIGVRSLNNTDFEFLNNRIDWDVLELLQNFGVNKIQNPLQLARAPEEFKQIVVANAVATLDHMKEGVSKIKETMESHQEIPEEVKPLIIAQSLDRITAMTRLMDRAIRTVGDTGAPELETMYYERLKEVRQLIDENMPKQGRGFMAGGFRAPPAPPRRPKDGFNFDLD